MHRGKQLLALVTTVVLLMLPGLAQHAWAEPTAPSSTGVLPGPTTPAAPTRTLPGAPSASSTGMTATGTVSGSEPDTKAQLPGISDPRWEKLPPEKKQEILAKAKTAGGMAVCDQIPGISSITKLKEMCASKTAPLFTVAKGAVAVTVCTPIRAMMPPGLGLVGGFDCGRVVVRLLEGKGWDAFKGTIMGELGRVAGAVASTVKFIANPMGNIDDLANSTKDTAVGLSKGVLEHAARSNNASLGSEQFRKDYAAGAGIGLFVAAVMLLITFWQAARGSIDPDTLIESLIVRAPMGILLIFTGPGIGYVLQQSINGISEAIASATGMTMGQVLSKLVAILLAATVGQIPGGALAGIVLFLAVIVGAFSVLVTTVMLDFGLYMTSAVLSLAFAMRINPLWRPKVRKLEAGWAAILLMKPLFMLLLGLAFGFLSAKLGVSGAGSSGMDLLITIVTIAAVMITIGFAPMAIMKHAPILPGGNELSESSSSGSGAIMAGAAGGLMSQIAMQRASAGQAAGRAGAAGPPGPPGSTGPSAPSSPTGPATTTTTAGGGSGPVNPPNRTPVVKPPARSAPTTTAGTRGAASTTASRGAAAGGGPAGIAAIAAMQSAQGLQALRGKADQLSRVAAPRLGEAEGE